MAKIRVYELARDLNMTNKVLVEKLLAMDLPVKSHMSTLETELIDKVKAEVLGTKPREYEYEETRVQATIIRRRRKVIRRKKAANDVLPEPTPAAPAESLESTPVEPAEPIGSDQASTADTNVVTGKAAVVPIDTKPADERDDLPLPEPEAETETLTPENELSSAEDAAQEAVRSDADPAKPFDEAAAEVKPLKPVRKKKKKKKETPAKIIQLAPLQPEKTSVEPTSHETPATPLPPVSDMARKKGKAGKNV